MAEAQPPLLHTLDRAATFQQQLPLVLVLGWALALALALVLPPMQQRQQQIARRARQTAHL
jgi:hypothetical protein